MSSASLQEVHSHTHLGVTIAKNLRWDEHIENVSVKADQCLGILKALEYKLDHNMLWTLYFAFVLSKLE